MHSFFLFKLKKKIQLDFAIIIFLLKKLNCYSNLLLFIIKSKENIINTHYKQNNYHLRIQ